MSRGLARIDFLRSPAELLQVCRGRVADSERKEQESAAAVAAVQAAAQHRYSSASAELAFAEGRLEAAAEIAAVEDLSERGPRTEKSTRRAARPRGCMASLGLDLAAFRRAGPGAAGPGPEAAWRRGQEESEGEGSGSAPSGLAWPGRGGGGRGRGRGPLPLPGQRHVRWRRPPGCPTGGRSTWQWVGCSGRRRLLNRGAVALAGRGGFGAVAPLSPILGRDWPVRGQSGVVRQVAG